jgi:hypothetical protein
MKIHPPRYIATPCQDSYFKPFLLKNREWKAAPHLKSTSSFLRARPQAHTFSSFRTLARSSTTRGENPPWFFHLVIPLLIYVTRPGRRRQFEVISALGAGAIFIGIRQYCRLFKEVTLGRQFEVEHTVHSAAAEIAFIWLSSVMVRDLRWKRGRPRLNG